MKAIVSYPRSGNHLCRFLVEYITGSSTQGCIGTVGDVPICENKFPNNPDVLSHVEIDNIIAQKAHSAKELKNYGMSLGINPERILFIFRNPVDAILSHTPPKQFSGDKLLSKISLEMDIWMDLVYLFVRTPLKCEAIFYDDLISDNMEEYSRALTALCRIFDSESDFGRLFHVINSYDEMKKISASGKGRTWSGVRSIGKGPYYHLDRFEDDHHVIMREFESKMVEFIKKLEKSSPGDGRVKYPRLDLILETAREWKINIRNWLEEN